MTQAEEIAEGLSEAERAWLLYWTPPTGAKAVAWRLAVAYPRIAKHEREVMEYMAYIGLARVKREMATVDGETDEYVFFGVTPLGREVAAVLQEQKG